MREKKTSESHTRHHLSSLITPRCVHWMSISELSALLSRTRDRSDANLGKRVVSFAACLVCGFLTSILRSTAEINGQKLIEDMNGLF